MSKAVIFIPGIKGTKLYDSNTVDHEFLWQDFRFQFEDFMRLELTPPFNGQYYDESLTTIARPSNVEPIAYSEFWKNFESEFKFIFPYDWRLPNKENGKRLKEFMDLIIEKSKASSNNYLPITHFDFVTHSMGNMPLRYYILENGMKNINKIIFITPPFKGSPVAISALAVGQGFFNKEDSRKLARTLPALFELLPTYQKYAIDSNDSSTVDLWDINNWQENLIKQDGNTDKDRTKQKFVDNLGRAKIALHELDNWNKNLSEEEKTRIMILVRTEEETLQDVVIEKNPRDNNPKNYIDFDKSFSCDEGDGTVPNASSCIYHQEFVTYCFEKRFPQDDYKHALIMKDSRIQRVINGFLKSPLNAQLYDHGLIGRNVHLVTSLSAAEIKQDGLTHTIAVIKK